jgi:hypothetical protein
MEIYIAVKTSNVFSTLYSIYYEILSPFIFVFALCTFYVFLYSDIGSVGMKNQCLESVQLALRHVRSEDLANLLNRNLIQQT